MQDQLQQNSVERVTNFTPPLEALSQKGLSVDFKKVEFSDKPDQVNTCETHYHYRTLRERSQIRIENEVLLDERREALNLEISVKEAQDYTLSFKDQTVFSEKKRNLDLDYKNYKFDKFFGPKHAIESTNDLKATAFRQTNDADLASFTLKGESA